MRRTILSLALLGLGLAATTASASTVLDTGPFGIGQDESIRLVLKSAPPDDGPTTAGLTCRVRVEAPLADGVKPKPLTYLLRPGQTQTVDITPETIYAAGQPITAPKAPPRWYLSGRVTVDTPKEDPGADGLCGKLVSGLVEVASRQTGEVRLTHDLTQVF